MTDAALIAALPMYDDPDIAWASDALWAAMAASLRENGIEAPAALTRGGNLDAQWRNPGLLFGQTCGYPYVKRLRDAVVLIATPEHAFPGCEGVAHRSFLVRSARDPRRELEAFRGGSAAVNALDSNTGMNLFRAAIAPIAHAAPFFETAAVTGSHEASLLAVAEGRADLAAIDCVSFALIARRRSDLIRRVAIVAESPPSPGLPFIASARLQATTICVVRAALFAALADRRLSAARAALGLKGAQATTLADYDRVLELEREAEAAGYPCLA